MSAEEVAAAFVNHYYTTFDTNPANLAGLYVSHVNLLLISLELLLSFILLSSPFYSLLFV